MSAPQPAKSSLLQTVLSWINAIANLEAHAPRITGLPAWVNVVGYAYHLLIGAWLSFVPNGAWIALGIGIGHEVGDGDLLGPTGPWDGLLDILAFVLPSIIRGLL